jgi:hypothetical protein
LRQRLLGKVFRVDDSFFFAAQIPDNSVGCSGSRCSNCGAKTAYCVQICRECDLPFVGPCGFPQISGWEKLSLGEKTKMVKEIYRHEDKQRGRLGYKNIASVPLTPEELLLVEDLDGHDFALFLAAHEIKTKKLREILVL